MRQVLGYLPQEFGVYPNITAQGLLDHVAVLKGITNSNERKEMVKYLLQKVNLYDKRKKLVKSFSGGMKQRVGIAQALIGNPQLIIVDEPTAGLDPRERIRFRNLLVELSRERIVIFSTHIIEDISSSCNQVAVINRGNLKYFGTPNDMVNMGNNFVWQFSIPAKEFDTFANKQMIVHHMRDGDKIRVRCLAKEKPTHDAVNVSPHLEDAYLCLLKDFV